MCHKWNFNHQNVYMYLIYTFLTLIINLRKVSKLDIFTRHTLVWKCIVVDVFFSVRLQISRRQWHRSARNFAWLYLSVPCRSSPLLGAVSPVDPQIPNYGQFWPFDHEYLENGKLQRYTSIRAKHQLHEGFLKM